MGYKYLGVLEADGMKDIKLKEKQERITSQGFFFFQKNW